MLNNLKMYFLFMVFLIVWSFGLEAQNNFQLKKTFGNTQYSQPKHTQKSELFELDFDKLYYQLTNSKEKTISLQMDFAGSHHWNMVLEPYEAILINTPLVKSLGLSSFKGYLQDEAGSLVHISVSNQSISGIIRRPGNTETYYFETAITKNKPRYVKNKIWLFSGKDISKVNACSHSGLIENKPHIERGILPVPNQPTKQYDLEQNNKRSLDHDFQKSLSACREIRLAIIIDSLSVASVEPGQNEAQAVSHLNYLLGHLNAAYIPTNTQYVVTNLLIFTGSGIPFSTEGSASDVVNVMTPWVQTEGPQWFPNPYDVVSLLRTHVSGGYAWLDNVCGDFNCLATSFGTIPDATDGLLWAHEMGHMWGSNHVNNGTAIMNPIVWPGSTFLPQTVDLVIQSADAAPCVVDCGITIPDTSIIYYGSQVKIEPTSGTFSPQTLMIELTTFSSSSCEVYYTTDGSIPDQNSTLYTGAFPLVGVDGDSITIQAIAWCDGIPTDITSELYVFDIPITITWGTQMSCNTPYAYIYNLNGVIGTELVPWPGIRLTDLDDDGWHDLEVFNYDCFDLTLSCGDIDEVSIPFSGICDDPCFEGTIHTVATADCSRIGCPVAVVEDAFLACDRLIINTTGSSNGSAFSFSWTTTNGGTIEVGDTTLFPQITSHGSYTLSIINSTTGCMETAQAVVTQAQIEAGEGALICPGESTMLNGSTSGTPFAVKWEPSTNLSDPNILNPVATLDETTTFTLTTDWISGNNLISNGDFEQGDVGFFTEYQHGTGAPGLYFVSDNPNDFWYEFSECDDHTAGAETDQMMVVDGVGTPGTKVWCQIITIEPNQSYTFSVWVTSVLGFFPAELQFSINDILLGDIFIAPLPTCNWQQFFETWDSGGNTTAEICIVNQNLLSGGNDFALDDISFTRSCQIIDTVTILVDDLLVEADDIQIDCNSNTPINLSITASSSFGSDFDYQWTASNGGFINSGGNTAAPEVIGLGTYTYRVTNLATNCSTEGEILVTPLDLDIVIATPDTLNCYLLELSIDASQSTNASNFEISWSSQDGNIISGETTLTPSVNSPGTYTLTITNLDDGCFVSEDVVIIGDLNPPLAIANGPGNLDCLNPEVILSGVQSSSSGNISFEWTTQDGNIVSNENTLSPLVDAAGTYILTVTNQDNGCTDMDQVTLTADTTPPQAIISNPEELNCSTPSIVLDGNSSSSGDNFSYSWITSEGNIISGDNTTSPTVNGAGLYLLLVTNNVNGCTAGAEIEVFENITAVQANIATSQNLDCTTTTLMLDGSQSSSGNNISIIWTTENGDFIDGENTLTPSINSAGTYLLTVIDTTNDCTASDQVSISQDTISPLAIASYPFDLDCINSIVTLDGSASGNNPNLLFDWSTTNGNFLSDSNTATPVIDAPGVYELLVSNIDNGCTAMTQLTVSQDVEIPTVLIETPDTIDCNSLNIILNAGESSQGSMFTNTWSTQDGNILENPSTLSPTVDMGGSYSLSITNTENGCFGIETVNVIENDDPLIDFDAIASPPDCFGEAGSLSVIETSGGEGPFMYSVDGGNTFITEPVFDLEPANYNVFVIDANGCEVESTITIPTIPEIFIDLDQNVSVSLGESYQVNLSLINLLESDIATISWSPIDGLSCSDCLNPIILAFENAVYTINIATVNGCEAIATLNFEVENEVNIYIPNAFSPYNSDGINDVFMIFANDTQISRVVTFNIFNRWGDYVYKQEDFQPNDPRYGWDGTFHGKLMNSGVFVYFAEIELVDGRKIIYKGDVTLVR